MGAHRRTFARLESRLAMATDSASRDAILDQWLDVSTLATDYDADQWGLNPDDPMWQVGSE
jgi:hypothetical protein